MIGARNTYNAFNLASLSHPRRVKMANEWRASRHQHTFTFARACYSQNGRFDIRKRNKPCFLYYVIFSCHNSYRFFYLTIIMLSKRRGGRYGNKRCLNLPGVDLFTFSIIACIVFLNATCVVYAVTFLYTTIVYKIDVKAYE